MTDVHERLRRAKLDNRPAEELDEILWECTDNECGECGRIICPLGEPLHFHHDGCPAEAEREGESLDLR
jgi:hypothetical protein